ncbi:MAG: GIY-YIG nuclease family protein [Synechococcus sp.]
MALPPPRQGELFGALDRQQGSTPTARSTQLPEQLTITAAQLRDWQHRIYCHQQPLLHQPQPHRVQPLLFSETEQDPLTGFDPLTLRALPLSFWRWPSSPHRGAAIYLVMDRPEHLETPIVLYVGETLAADRRWKGEHDCKAYLAAYGEALSCAGLTSTLSIRFWGDVPDSTRDRRRLEQRLIQTWQPPFNKETRARWATPFTTD